MLLYISQVKYIIIITIFEPTSSNVCLCRTNDHWSRQHPKGHLGYFMCITGETGAGSESALQ